MKKSYKVIILKDVETYNYKEGLKNDTRSLGKIHSFKTEFITSVISELYSFFGNGIKEVENMENYFSITRLENEDSNEPSENEMNQWKKGSIDLYSCYYTVSIETVIEEDFTYFDYKSLETIIKES